MNASVLNTLAEVAITLAGFSGVSVVFRLHGAHSWSPTELRVLWFLIGDSFLVLFFSLLPFPLALANRSSEALWGFCNALLGSWFIVGDVLALRGERRDRVAPQQITVPVITPILYVMSICALAMGITLWLSALDLLVARGQAVYVLGLIALLAQAHDRHRPFPGQLPILWHVLLLSLEGRLWLAASRSPATFTCTSVACRWKR